MTLVWNIVIQCYSVIAHISTSPIKDVLFNNPSTRTILDDNLFSLDDSRACTINRSGIITTSITTIIVRA
jgi:hypothetical protein